MLLTSLVAHVRDVALVMALVLVEVDLGGQERVLGTLQVHILPFRSYPGAVSFSLDREDRFLRSTDAVTHGLGGVAAIRQHAEARESRSLRPRLPRRRAAPLFASRASSRDQGVPC